MQATLVEGIGIRFREALGGRTYQWLSDETGISTSMLSDYGKGTKTPGADKAVLIADALEIELSWLLTGRGSSTGRYFLPSDIIEQYGLAPGSSLRHPNSSLIEKNPDSHEIYSGEPLSHSAEPDPDVVEIDEIDLRYGLGATFVDVPIEAQKRVFSRSWLRNFTTSSPEHLFWTAGEGDSMDPTIRSGEIVLIDTAQKIPRMSGGIWAITMGEIGMIKRLHVPGRNRIELLSDNAKEPPIKPVDDDELQIVGRVVAVVRKL